MVVVMIMTIVMIKIDGNDSIWQENKAKMKIPKDFNKITESKILGNPVPKNPGIEILDPARAWWGGRKRRGPLGVSWPDQQKDKDFGFDPVFALDL